MGKMVKQLLLASALGTLGLASAANAAIVVTQIDPENTLTFDNNPVGATSGSSVVCDWAYCGGIKFSTDGKVANGTTPLVSATPAGDTSNYLYGVSTTGATIAFAHPTQSFNIFWGSIDGNPPRYDNIMTLVLSDSSTVKLFGHDLETGGAHDVGADGSGDQFSASENQWLNIAVTGDAKIVGFNAYSGQPAFEFDMAAPEPATWAMMGLGFAALGYAAFRRKAKSARTVAA